MRQGPDLLSDDEWRDALATNFNGLIPDHRAMPAEAGAAGWLSAARLGNVAAFHVAGRPQVLGRSPAMARRIPSDLLKVCIQRSGSATIRQGDREVTLRPGSMAIYDIDRPYSIRLEGDWRCAVIAFPRTALIASRLFLDAMICQARLHRRRTWISSRPADRIGRLARGARRSGSGRVGRPHGPGEPGPAEGGPCRAVAA